MPDLPEPTTDEWDDEEDDDLFDDENQDFLPLKHCFDGIETVAALSVELRRVADHLDERTAAGWRLASPVDNCYVHLTRFAV